MPLLSKLTLYGIAWLLGYVVLGPLLVWLL
jgi:hypothetical protein